MGRKSSKECWVFLILVDKGRLFFTKLSFEEFEIFITADRSAWPVLKGNQAAKFRRVFWYISRYSIVKKITGSSNVGESYGIFTVRFSTWAIFDTQPANEFYLKVCFFWLFNICALSLLQRGSRKYRFYLENSRGRLNGLRATNSDSLARMTDIERSRNQSSKDYE